MNKKMVFSTLGQLTLSEAALMTLPLIVALIYGEIKVAASFLIAIGIALTVGVTLYAIFKTENKVIYAKEGFIIVAFGWIIMSLIGALPFVLSGDIPSYVDAFFETVSGFTTTGASILRNVEALSRGGLFWRSFTHWVGGMGVLVFIMAILPSISDRSIHIMRAEMPGPIVGKIVPRARETARILYVIYFAMTVLEVVLLLIGGMPLFESVIHSFGTAGTGGFGAKGDSIASYSPYLQWVITVFMFLFGVNFNIYYLLLMKKVRSVVKSTEFWAYFGITAAATAIICANILPTFDNFGDALRASAFQVSSIITTTGYSTVDFNLWPTLSKTVLLCLMFIGACAGSTGGGFKVTRVVIVFKAIKQELKRLTHPRSVSVAKFEGKSLDRVTLNGVNAYLALYTFSFIGIVLMISFEPFNFETTFSAALSCFNNIGPGIGAVGPMGSFADYTGFSKIILSFAMLFGRLEIYPLLIALTPSTWTKK
ncbi:MAG: TrkH family potassium uptake protein [Clostridia bacterium]|nr:TrkH family potassium uptake protein [Clostridia bacterium]